MITHKAALICCLISSLAILAHALLKVETATPVDCVPGVDDISCWLNRGVCRQDAAQRTVSTGMPIRDDTFGQLIANQMMWRIPGLDYLAHGFNTITGATEVYPIFLFCYQEDSLKTRRLQDTYRGNVYVIPKEVYASASPTCTYSLDTKKYDSAQEYAAEMMQSTSLSGSMSASYSGWGFSASVQASFSKESSVSAARNVQQKQSGSLSVTSVSCETSVIKVSSTFSSFHPYFIQALYQADTAQDYYNLFTKYGTHYYRKAVLGGKLVQISSTSHSYSSSKSESEYNDRVQAGFSASAGGWGISASASGDYSQQQQGKRSEQTQYEENTSKSSIISYGGAPGSFGPSKDSSSAGDWGEWAKTTDLLPIPITYQLGSISDLIPSNWKNVKNASINENWVKNLKDYWGYLQSQIILERNKGQNIYYFNMVIGEKGALYSGPYGFKLKSAKTTMQATYFKERMPMYNDTFAIVGYANHLTGFNPNTAYLFSFSRVDIPDFDGDLELCDEKGISGQNPGPTGGFSSWGITSLTLTDQVYGNVYHYSLPDGLPDSASGCVQIKKDTTIAKKLTLSFGVTRLSPDLKANYPLQILVTGTQGTFEAFSSLTALQSLGKINLQFDSPDIGYLTALEIRILIPSYISSGLNVVNDQYAIDGTNLIVSNWIAKDSMGNAMLKAFVAANPLIQNLTATSSVRYGLELV